MSADATHGEPQRLVAGGRGRGRLLGELGLDRLAGALDRVDALAQGVELAARRRRGGEPRDPLGELGERRGGGVGALARLARDGGGLVGAAAEDRDGLGHRLDLAFERGDAVGKRRIGRRGARVGERGLDARQPGGEIVDGGAIGRGGQRTRGQLAQLLLEPSNARIRRGRAGVAAGNEVGDQQRGQHRGAARHAGAERQPGPRAAAGWGVVGFGGNGARCCLARGRRGGGLRRR